MTFCSCVIVGSLVASIGGGACPAPGPSGARPSHHSVKLSSNLFTFSATTAGDYVARAKRAGLSWPLTAELGDEELERQLFPLRTSRATAVAEPD